MRIIYITHQARKVRESDKFDGFYDEWKVSDYHQLLWATTFAIEAIKYSNKHTIESWTLYDEQESPNIGIVTEHFNNITFRAFPAKKLFKRYISIPMIQEIKNKVNNKEKILIHIQAGHDYSTYLLSLFCKNIPLICTPRSGAPPIENFHVTNRNPKKLNYLLAHAIDIITLKYIDYFFVSSIGGYQYLRKFGFNSISYERTTGINIERCPLLDKTEVRKELGLTLNKKIILFVWRYNELKGADIAIKVYKELNKKLDIEMVHSYNCLN